MNPLDPTHLRVFDNVLNDLRFSESRFYPVSLLSPWSVRVPRHRDTVRIHFVTRGQCWIGDGIDSPFCLLNKGDCVVVPAGNEHLMRDRPDRATMSVHDMPGDLQRMPSPRTASGRRRTEMFCGYCMFDRSSSEAMRGALPSLLILKEKESPFPGLIRSFVDLLDCESPRPMAGRCAMLARAAEILMLAAISHHAERKAFDQGLFGAMRDPAVAVALAAIHAKPNAEWTVSSLARLAGTSRSRFAQHFASLMDTGPVEYVRSVRLAQARRWLIQTTLPLGRIAAESGYESVSAFTRAFRRMFSVSPASFRREPSARLSE